jgi:hypothetical protein
MDLTAVRKSVKAGAVQWQRHALQRMLERNISRTDVKDVILNGTIIEEYHYDKPFPSVLIARVEKHHALHVVIAWSDEDQTCYVITAYVPDEKHFEDDLMTRKKQ